MKTAKVPALLRIMATQYNEMFFGISKVMPWSPMKVTHKGFLTMNRK